MKPTDTIETQKNRRFRIAAAVLILVVSCAALFISTSSRNTNPATVGRDLARATGTTRLVVWDVTPVGSIPLQASSAPAKLPTFVIHLPARSYFKEPDGTLQVLPSAKAIAGRSLDLIDSRYQPEIDLRK